MIPCRITEIAASALQALIASGVAENKTIEYKRAMPGKADSDVVPFLAAISSFANSSGGDLIIGMEEAAGLPTNVVGVALADLDKERLRIEQLVANGLEPRLPRFEIGAVEVNPGLYVLVCRVPQRSWVAPHRVKKNDKFYGRSSAGRYPLDVGELRSAFTFSETIAERVRQFRIDRVSRIQADETPVPLKDRARMCLHVLPLSSFTEMSEIDLSAFYQRDALIRPMNSSGWDSRINLEGFLSHSVIGEDGSRDYTQLFRNGRIEAVATLRTRDDGSPNLPGTGYEETLIESLRSYSTLVRGLGVEGPVYAMISFINVKGAKLGVSPEFWRADELYPLQNDVLILPELMFEGDSADYGRLLKPAFDLVWNAFGMPGSLNYDEQSNWREWRR